MITETGREMLRFQEQLAKDYGYQPIGYNLFLGDVRQKYLDALPEWCKVDGNSESPLFTDKGTQISTGYKRIVIGDYGAFIEMSQEQMVMDNIQICGGQEYRVEDERFKDHVKYLWYTSKDWARIKLYFQKKTVSYADYIPEMWYVSVYEVFPNREIQ